jgi:glutathione S-transferase
VALLLYDNPASSNALKVRFLLAELGLEYERVHVPFAQPRPEWFTRHHPFGRIPLLEDGDVRVGESNTILRYLAQSSGRADLYPDAPASRAAVDWALDTWSTLVRPVLSPIERAVIFNVDPEHGGGTLDTADRQALDAALPDVGSPLDAFERFVADNGTVLGTFTIADCAVGPVLWRTKQLPLDFERWPKVALLRETISTNPSFVAAGPVA